MQNKRREHYHFISPGDALIAAYGDVLDKTVLDAEKTLTLDVGPDMVLTDNVGLPQSVMLSLQHYPHHIRHLLWAIDFRFPESAGGSVYIDERVWKREARYDAWFSKLHSVPFSIFFVKDADVRTKVLAGDLMAEGFLAGMSHTADGKTRFGINGPLLDELCKRLLNSCWMMHVFCHQSGFDPKPAIESLLNQYTLPVHYKKVVENYQLAIKNKVNFAIDYGAEQAA